MMISQPPGTLLYELCRIVARLKPGEAVQFDQFELRRIPSYEHNGATFTPADRILGNIVGSAYTHSYSMSPIGDITFYRHEETGEIYHRDPDRR